MWEVKPYFDYCIPVECLQNGNYKNTIKTLYDLGYRTIAINQNVDDSNEANESEEQPKKKKKTKKGAQEPQIPDLVPEPFKIEVVEGAQGMRILNRLTIVFSDQLFLYKVTKHINYRKYQIIATLPTAIPALAFICSSFEADIFTFNPENKFSLKLSRKSYRQLIDRGYHLEILYGPCIQDTTKRKNFIHLAHLYHVYGKSKNVIVSSGAVKPMFIRSPYDVINLGLIFGLNEMQAKNAISHCGRNLYLKAVGRNHGKGIMFFTHEPLVSSISNGQESASPEKENEDVGLVTVDVDMEDEMSILEIENSQEEGGLVTVDVDTEQDMSSVILLESEEESEQEEVKTKQSLINKKKKIVKKKQKKQNPRN